MTLVASRQELPKLRSDLEDALTAAMKQLDVMGDSRTTSAECKAYLTQLSLEYYEFCKAAVDGHYEGDYFNTDGDNSFSLKSAATVRRLRAVIQHMNTGFSDTMRNNGHKYQISASSVLDSGRFAPLEFLDPESQTQALGLSPNKLSPTKITKGEALEWVRQVLMRTRGRELVGNFNPLLVGELFWEQCSNWNRLAVNFLDDVDEVCNRFLAILLADKCPKDIVSRLHASLIRDALRARKDEALQELRHIIEDTRYYPINYNHYYTDTLYHRRQERNKASLASCIGDATTNHVLEGCKSNEHTTASVNVEKAVDAYSKGIDPNMENVSCEEALDCLFAIYKVGGNRRTHQ